MKHERIGSGHECSEFLCTINVGLAQKITDILVLRQKETSSSMHNFNTEKIIKGSKILEREPPKRA